MKKYLFVLLAALLAGCALVSCDLFSSGEDEPRLSQTDAVTTAATSRGDSTATTSAPPVTTAPTEETPTLAELAAMVKGATPTAADSDITADYTSPAVTLTAELSFRHTATADSYVYRTDRLLTAAEALLSGSPIGESSGRLEISGSSVTAATPEITEGLLAEIGTVSVRLPTLRRDLLSTCEITRTGSTVTLTATAKDGSLPILFDTAVTGIRDVSLTMTFDATAGRPTALVLSFATEGGGSVVCSTEYSYE